MERASSKPRQALWIVLLAIAGFIAWTLLSARVARPEVAESNFQANLIRLERWKLDPAPADVLVGSSIGARLLPRYFRGTALDGMHNLSLDGSGPSLGLRLLLEGTNQPRRVFIEVHRLGKPWHPNDDAVLAAAHSPGMRLAGWLRGIRAEARPSTLMFAWIKSHQRSAGAPYVPTPAASTNSGSTSNRGHAALHRPFTPKWESDLARDVAALKQRGIRAVLIRFPVGRENPVDAEARSGSDELSDHLGIPLVDLQREAFRRGLEVRYTDNLHLTPQSAEAVSRILADWAAKNP